MRLGTGSKNLNRKPLTIVFERSHEAYTPFASSKHCRHNELETWPRSFAEVAIASGCQPRCFRRGGLLASIHGLFRGRGGRERNRKRGGLGRGRLPLREGFRL